MASLWMLLAAFLFAGMGACVKLASTSFSTSEIVMYRGLVGTVVLLAMIRHQGGTLRTAFPREHLWRSFVGVVSLWLWFYAIGKLPLATAVTLNYMAPIWMAAYLFIKGLVHARHRVAWPLLAAIGASFIGVTLVLRPAVEAQQWVGGLVGLASSVLSAMAYMQVRRLGLMGEPEYRVVFYFSLMSCVAGAAANVASGAGWHAPTWHQVPLLLGIGISAMFAQMAMTRAYRVGKVLVVANLQYVGIVFSSLLGMVLWNDTFDWHVWLGMGIILASGMAASFYNTREAST
ncbi:MAG: DMT family transporter [Pseudomonadota bacterium]